MYVDGTLDPGEVRELERHLDACTECRRTVAQYKLLAWDLRHLPADPVPREVHELGDRLMAAWVRHVTVKAAGGAETVPRQGTLTHPTRSGRPVWASLRPALAGAASGLAQVPGVPVLGRGIRGLGRALPRVGVALALRLVRRGGAGHR